MTPPMPSFSSTVRTPARRRASAVPRTYVDAVRLCAEGSHAHHAGVFRLAETLPGTEALGSARNAQAERAPRIIEAEWDAKRHRVALKRKRDPADVESGPAAPPPHSKRTQRQAQDATGGDAAPDLAQFSGMLQEYLQCMLRRSAPRH